MSTHRPNMLCRASMGRNRRTWWYSVVATPAGATPETGTPENPHEEGISEPGDQPADRPDLS